MKKNSVSLHLLLALFIVLFSSKTVPGEVLRQNDVERSVRTSFPPLLAALQEIRQADGEALSAKGWFDTTLRGKADNNSLGYYENRAYDVSLEQPLSWGGANLFGGWRLGEGTFPIYDGKLDTRSLGESRVGARLPLLRDRAIDSRRAELGKTVLGQDSAKLSVEQQRLAIMSNAIQRYWLWVAAGHRLRIGRNVLDIAKNRQALLDKAADSGQIPAIDAIDNRRAILQRQSQVVEAERGLQGAALDLSLLYRDAQGNPIIPAESELPDEIKPADDTVGPDTNTAIARALQERPDALRIAAQRAAAEIDLKAARNAKLPGLDLTSTFTSESGTGIVKRGPQEFRAGITFELPFQRRVAEGRIQASQAKVTQLVQRERYARDSIREEVQDALSALQTAFERVRLTQEELLVTRQLEQAERIKFDFGEGTLFLLNLREQATLESAVRSITALSDHQRAFAALRYATGDL